MLRVNSLSGFGRIVPAAGGGTPPVFIAAGSIVQGISDATPVLPAHQANDILIVSANNDGNVPITEPGDWASIATGSGGAAHNWAWKRAASGSETDPLFTAAGGQTFAIAYVIRGCVTTGTPYEDATVVAYSTSAHTTPFTADIDTTGSDRLVASFFARGNDLAWDVAPPPSLWDLDDDQTTTLGTDARFTVVSKTQSSAGAVAAVQIGTWAAGTSNWRSVTLGFIPA